MGDVRTRITQSLFNLALERVLESLGVAQALTASSRIIPGAQNAGAALAEAEAASPPATAALRTL